MHPTRLLPVLLVITSFWASPTLAEEPADQVILSKYVAARWFPDGRQSIRVRTERRLLTDFAVRRLSDPRIRFDDGLQELIVHAHEVKTPDGETVVAPDYARNESQADGIGRTVDFASVVEVVATQVGAQRDAVLTLDYEIIDREAFRPALDLSLLLGGSAPIRQLEVTVTIPKDTRIDWAMSPADDSLTAAWPVGGDDVRILQILGTDLPAYNREPGGQDETPRLLVSTWSEWRHALGHLDNRLKVAFEARTECDLAAALAAASDHKGLPGALHAVRNGLRIVPGERPGRRLAPRSVCRVWASGYATPLEAAMVLFAAFGDDVTGGVALSTGGALVADNVPGLTQWTEVSAWVIERRGASRVYWTPASDSIRYHHPTQPGDARISFNLLHPPKHLATKVTPRRRHRDLKRPSWRLEEERTYRAVPAGGLSLVVRVDLRGRPDIWLPLAEAKDLEDGLTARLKPLLPGSSLEKLAVTRVEPNHLEFEATLVSDVRPGPAAAIPLGTVFRAPDDLAGIVLIEDRATPLILNLDAEVTQTLGFDGLAAAGLALRETGVEPRNPRHPVVRALWSTGGAFVRTLRSSEALVEPAHWSAVRTELGAWLQDQGRMLFLLAPGEAPRE